PKQPNSTDSPLVIRYFSDTPNSRYSVLDNEEDNKGNEVYFLFPYKLVTYVSVLIREVTSSFNNLVKNHCHLYNLAGTYIPAAVYISYDI
ncbi:uncharacterized protein N7479_002541, partial [Penicillium vulpinum]|uniref:uncharacterized protein n=1 Tax=Penicillium vulpinum TaxID=29845 RepID=UPI0025482514